MIEIKINDNRVNSTIVNVPINLDEMTYNQLILFDLMKLKIAKMGFKSRIFEQLYCASIWSHILDVNFFKIFGLNSNNLLDKNGNILKKNVSKHKKAIAKKVSTTQMQKVLEPFYKIFYGIKKEWNPPLIQDYYKFKHKDVDYTANFDGLIIGNNSIEIPGYTSIRSNKSTLTPSGRFDIQMDLIAHLVVNGMDLDSSNEIEKELIEVKENLSDISAQIGLDIFHLILKNKASLKS